MAEEPNRWRLETTSRGENSLRKLDKPVLRRIRKYLEEVDALDNPRDRGKPLTANKAGLWAYRQGSWRVVCDIQDEKLVILVVDAGPRQNIYDD